METSNADVTSGRALTMALALGLLGLAGCKPSAMGPPDAATDAATADAAPPSFPRPCADLYDQAILPTFGFTIDPAEWAAMGRDCENRVQAYRPIVFTYGAESQAAMVRLKGFTSWNCDKMQFVVSFNEVDPHARFHGLRKIVLDAPGYDPTLLRERMAFDQLARGGAPSSCANNARLVINGEYYGVYVNLERIDHEYLERHFDEPDGNLYQAGTELKTNEDVADTSDRDAYWAVTDVHQLDALVDLDEAVVEWANDAMLPNPDGYWAGVQINFYLYHHPTRGFVYLPYDEDYAFSHFSWNDGPYADPITFQNGVWGRELHYQLALADPVWCAAFIDALEAARAAYDVNGLQHRLDVWSAQIADAVANDRHKPFTTEAHLAAVSALRDFYATRAAFVDQWLAVGNRCPVTW